MNLKFSLRQYVIESGNIVILRSGSFSPPGNQVILPNGQIVPLPDTDFKAKPLSILEGLVNNVAFSEPGKFTALLTDLVVLRRSDQKRFHVPQFTIREFPLTASDLKRGAAEIPINVSGLFQVVVLDRDGKRAPNKVICFTNMRVGERELVTLVTIRSDEQGEITMFGSSADFYISLAQGEEQGGKLQILPL